MLIWSQIALQVLVCVILTTSGVIISLITLLLAAVDTIFFYGRNITNHTAVFFLNLGVQFEIWRNQAFQCVEASLLALVDVCLQKRHQLFTQWFPNW